MGKPAKSFREGETPPFKTPTKSPSGRGRRRVCKNPTTSPEKNHLHVLSASVSPTRTMRSGRGQLSRGSSEVSDEPPSAEFIHRARAQKSLAGLNSALAHHVAKFRHPETLEIDVDDYQPSGSAAGAHHRVPTRRVSLSLPPKPVHERLVKSPPGRWCIAGPSHQHSKEM
ncbi:hypothetical protein MMC12_007954 [Toensbergia leucococca]|nr:hypothetical protein [Toensbergia leucococca]